MPMPAVPAMPTSEYGSAACTFSMSRLAMRLPMVARRSPAITTPSAKESATMVVAWGATSAEYPGGSGRRPGSISGAAELRKSVNDEVPVLVNSEPMRFGTPPYEAGSRPAGSIPAATLVLSVIAWPQGSPQCHNDMPGVLGR